MLRKGARGGVTGGGGGRCEGSAMNDYYRESGCVGEGGGRQRYRRGRRLAGPERVSAGVTGREIAAVTGEARGGVIGGTGGGVAREVERGHYRRGRLQA